MSQRGSTAEASTSVSAEAGLQAAVWTRLLILMPLLPLVYADREPKPELNLRTALVRAVVRWATGGLGHSDSPTVRVTVAYSTAGVRLPTEGRPCPLSHMRDGRTASLSLGSCKKAAHVL